MALISQQSKQAGFTFLELLITSVVIGILASIALPAYQDYISRSKVVESLNITSDIRSRIAKYYQYTGKFPIDNFALGVPAPDDITGKYVQSVSVENGAIQVLFSDKNTLLSGKYISLRPVVVNNQPTAPIHFNCGYTKPQFEIQKIIGENKTNIQKNWLPKSCNLSE